MSVYRNLSLQSAGSVIKNSVGMLAGYDLYTTLSGAYVKFYDKATAPTSSDVVKFTVVLSNANPARITLPGDVVFNNGISIRATTGLADNDTGNPAANAVIGTVYYQ